MLLLGHLFSSFELDHMFYLEVRPGFWVKGINIIGMTSFKNSFCVYHGWRKEHLGKFVWNHILYEIQSVEDQNLLLYTLQLVNRLF